ncbi:alkaline phosphatase family protein [Streptomyces lasalocidi]
MAGFIRGRRQWRLAAGAAVVGAIAAVTLAPGSASAHEEHHPKAHKIGHVWTIILENKSYEATFTGLNQNSYLWKTLPSYGELLTQYYGTGHYSLDNYISLVSGQAPAPDNQNDCPQYKNVSPGTPAADGQVNAGAGCVYPSSVKTLFNQLDSKKVPWKVYAQDMGNTPSREDAYQCGIPGSPAYNGVPLPGGATPEDQYVAKHNPAPWFHSLIDNPRDCARVAPLNGLTATAGHRAVSGLAQDLKSEKTTPRFSWISPNNCSDAHDATCKGDNLSGDPNNHQGGLYASDKFLEKVVPQIMASPAYQHDGMIQIIFDEAFPPYKMYGNSVADYSRQHGQVAQHPDRHRPVGRRVLQRAARPEHHPARLPGVRPGHHPGRRHHRRGLPLPLHQAGLRLRAALQPLLVAAQHGGPLRRPQRRHRRPRPPGLRGRRRPAPVRRRRLQQPLRQGPGPGTLGQHRLPGRGPHRRPRAPRHQEALTRAPDRKGKTCRR